MYELGALAGRGPGTQAASASLSGRRDQLQVLRPGLGHMRPASALRLLSALFAQCQSLSESLSCLRSHTPGPIRNLNHTVTLRVMRNRTAARSQRLRLSERVVS